MARPKKDFLTLDDKDRIRDEITANCNTPGYDNDCWIYQGAISSEGYGAKTIAGETRNVSRFMLAYQTRDSLNIPFDACHKDAICPYKACCNPDHLYWATHAQNCAAREARAREEREMFRFWQTHAWDDGVYYTDRREPAIEPCLGNLNRGKIPSKIPDQSATDWSFLYASTEFPWVWAKVLDFLRICGRMTTRILIGVQDRH